MNHHSRKHGAGQATPVPAFGGLVEDFLIYDSILTGQASRMTKVIRSMKSRLMWKVTTKRCEERLRFAQRRGGRRRNRNS